MSSTELLVVYSDRWHYGRDGDKSLYMAINKEWYTLFYWLDKDRHGRRILNLEPDGKTKQGGKGYFPMDPDEYSQDILLGMRITCERFRWDVVATVEMLVGNWDE